MKTPIIFFSLLLYMFFGFAQNDSIYKEIQTAPPAKTVLLPTIRQVLMEKLLANDKTKTIEVVKYIETEIDDDYHTGLTINERWGLYLWTGQYDRLLSAVRNFDSTFIIAYNKRIRPREDALLRVMIDVFKASSVDRKLQIENSQQTKEEKAFLSLLNPYLTDVPVNRKQLDQDAKAFVSNYPHSPYTYFTNRYISPQEVLNKWGCGLDFSLGYGVFTQNVAQNLRNFGEIGIGFELYYKKWTLFLRDNIGISRTKQDIAIANTIWAKQSQANITQLSATMGYSLINTSKLQVKPFIGLAYLGIDAPSGDINQHPEYKNIDISSLTYIGGLNCDYLAIFKSKLYGETPFFTRLRIEYCLSNFNHNEDKWKGDLFRISLGMGLCTNRTRLRYSHAYRYNR